jgi:hypothetical protein
MENLDHVEPTQSKQARVARPRVQNSQLVRGDLGEPVRQLTPSQKRMYKKALRRAGMRK